MNKPILQRIQQRIFKLEIWLTLLLLIMPLILIMVDGKVRQSISNYAYMQRSYVFTFLLTTAAMLFVFNGALWVKRYNIYLGIALAGIILTPHLEFKILHYVFASFFFIGSIYVMIALAAVTNENIIAASLLITVALLGHFGTHWYSLFIAEWIALLPISIHYIGESSTKID